MGKKAVVLSGGGAKGGYQIGVWKVLRQMGFTPDIVVGTSVGALNGALMALDNFDAALDIWENMSMDSVFQNFVNMSDEENPDRESYIKELAKEAIFKGRRGLHPAAGARQIAHGRRKAAHLADTLRTGHDDVPEDKARRSFHRGYSRGQSRRLRARERGGVPVHEVI